MFDLEKAITEWRRQMAKGGVSSPEVLGELENHLREDMQRRIDSGSAVPQAFELAVAEVGRADLLGAEFRKVGAANWNRPLAMVAWTLFAISFFLPSYADGRGWQCAVVVLGYYWADAFKGNWFAIFSVLVGMTNFVALASPLLLTRFGEIPRILKWGRGLALIALLLVWSYIVLWVIQDGRDLKVGCFVWGASFLLLFLSTFRRRQRRTQYA